MTNDKLQITNEGVAPRHYYNTSASGGHNHLTFVIGNLTLALALVLALSSCFSKPAEQLKSVKVEKGSIRAQIPSTGIVEPRNRLEIKPPIAGRIDEVLAKEGEQVKKGRILAWMSSSDRAALLDAARAKGEEEVKRWEDVYKPTPIVAPLNGFVIQRAVEPGQTVSAGDAILVMADHLIVKAQVDETDIGSIRIGQNVSIELDAYPGKSISGKVEQVAYESKTVNNVTIYEVNVLPATVPPFFRAGMSATVNFILRETNDILVLPLNTIKTIGSQSYVFVQKDKNKNPQPLQIKTGLENTLHIEVKGGLAEGDEVVVPTLKMIQQLQSKFSHNRRGPSNPLQKKKEE